MPPAASPAAKNTPTPESIVRDVRAGRIQPVYYLMGEESYYIDRLADFLVDFLVKPEERDFNLLNFYGADVTIDDVITAAKGFPMGAQRMVVVVREAQNLKNIDRLAYYLQQPQPTTVLILCHKHGVLDRRKKIAAQIERAGCLFTSQRLNESRLPAFITDYLRTRRVAIDPTAAALLADHVGADLHRLASELDKLILALPGDEKTVTTDLVARQTGVSKEYNVFELQDALIRKDVARVMQIANYFDKTPKQNPIQKTLPALFSFFATLMMAHYAPDKSERALALHLGKKDYAVRKNVLPALAQYPPRKTMEILAQIRRIDARSKGVDNPYTPSGELMKELLFFILH